MLGSLNGDTTLPPTPFDEVEIQVDYSDVIQKAPQSVLTTHNSFEDEVDLSTICHLDSQDDEIELERRRLKTEESITEAAECAVKENWKRGQAVLREAEQFIEESVVAQHTLCQQVIPCLDILRLVDAARSPGLQSNSNICRKERNPNCSSGSHFAHIKSISSAAESNNCWCILPNFQSPGTSQQENQLSSGPTSACSQCN